MPKSASKRKAIAQKPKTIKDTLRGAFRVERPDAVIAHWGDNITFPVKLLVTFFAVVLYFFLVWVFASLTGPLLVTAPIVYFAWGRGGHASQAEVRWLLTCATIGAYFLFVKLFLSTILLVGGVVALGIIWVPSFIAQRRGGGGFKETFSLSGQFRPHKDNSREAKARRKKARRVLSVAGVLLFVCVLTPSAAARPTREDCEFRTTCTSATNALTGAAADLVKAIGNNIGAATCAGTAGDVSKDMATFSQAYAACKDAATAGSAGSIIGAGKVSDCHADAPVVSCPGGSLSYTALIPPVPKQAPVGTTTPPACDTWLQGRTTGVTNGLLACGFQAASAVRSAAWDGTVGAVVDKILSPSPPTKCTQLEAGTPIVQCGTYTLGVDACKNAAYACTLLPPPPESPAQLLLDKLLPPTQTPLASAPSSPGDGVAMPLLGGPSKVTGGDTPAGTVVDTGQKVLAAMAAAFGFVGISASVPSVPVAVGAQVTVTVATNQPYELSNTHVTFEDPEACASRTQTGTVTRIDDTHFSSKYVVDCRGTVKADVTSIGKVSTCWLPTELCSSTTSTTFTVPASAPAVTVIVRSTTPSVNGMFAAGSTLVVDATVTSADAPGNPDADVPVVHFSPVGGAGWACDKTDTNPTGSCDAPVHGGHATYQLTDVSAGTFTEQAVAQSAWGPSSVPVPVAFTVGVAPAITFSGVKVVQAGVDQPLVASGAVSCNTPALATAHVEWGHTADGTSFGADDKTFACNQGSTFALEHTYAMPGTFYVTVTLQMLSVGLTHDALTPAYQVKDSAGAAWFTVAYARTVKTFFGGDVQQPPNSVQNPPQSQSSGGGAGTNGGGSGTQTNTPGAGAGAGSGATGTGTPPASQTGNSSASSELGAGVKNAVGAAGNAVSGAVAGATNGTWKWILILAFVILACIVLFWFLRQHGSLAKFGIQPKVKAPPLGEALGVPKQGLLGRVFHRKPKPVVYAAPPSDKPNITFNVGANEPAPAPESDDFSSLDDGFGDMGSVDDFGADVTGSMRREKYRRRNAGGGRRKGR